MQSSSAPHLSSIRYLARSLLPRPAAPQAHLMMRSAAGGPRVILATAAATATAAAAGGQRGVRRVPLLRARLPRRRGAGPAASALPRRVRCRADSPGRRPLVFDAEPLPLSEGSAGPLLVACGFPIGLFSSSMHSLRRSAKALQRWHVPGEREGGRETERESFRCRTFAAQRRLCRYWRP
jgi:hypothetical protein